MAIDLVSTEQGVVLPIKASPGARKTEIRGSHDGRLRVAVTQVAEKGKANQAIMALLSKRLGYSKSQLILLSGQTGSCKNILVQGIDAAELKFRIESILSLNVGEANKKKGRDD